MTEVQLPIGSGIRIQADNSSMPGRVDKNIVSDSEDASFEEILNMVLQGQELALNPVLCLTETFAEVKQSDSSTHLIEGSDEESMSDELTGEIIARQAGLTAFAAVPPVMTETVRLDKSCDISNVSAEYRLSNTQEINYQHHSDEAVIAMTAYEKHDDKVEWISEVGLIEPLQSEDRLSAKLQVNQADPANEKGSINQQLAISEEVNLHTGTDITQEDVLDPVHLPLKNEVLMEKKDPVEKEDHYYNAIGIQEFRKNKSAGDFTIKGQEADLHMISLSQSQEFISVKAENEDGLQPVHDNSDSFFAAEQLIDQLKLTELNGKKELIVQLKPDSLGRVCIQLTQENGGTAARIVTDVRETSEMIQSQISILKQQFSDQGLTIGELEVVYDESSFMNGNFSDQRSADDYNSPDTYYIALKNEESAAQTDSTLPYYSMPHEGHINYLI